MIASRNLASGPGACALAGALALAALLAVLALVSAGSFGAAFWLLVLLFWMFAWRLAASLSALPLSGGAAQLRDIAVPLVFGATLILLWEFAVRGLAVPVVLLPAPSQIAARLAGSTPILWADFVQTYAKGALAGFAIGSGSGFLAALLIDRSPFLKAGLLPIGNLVSALPVIGIAPIMVMWFGFDWPSKAAVVAIMTFFPMLVNTVAGLGAAGALERDLMRTFAAGPSQTLLKLRLPAAMPFVFNALKINSTLALIGAIVAEFFGTPIVGMGFRISAEIGRLNTDMVWATITVAALAGSVSYGLLAALERGVTFWHPSQRSS